MNNNIISSKQNPLVKKLYRLREKKGRYREQAFLLEGPVVIKEALEEGYPIEALIIAEHYEEKIPWQEAGVPYYRLKDNLFDSLTDTVTKPGIMAIAPMIIVNHVQGGLWLYLDRIQDPGNLGTIIRCADAFGVGGVMLSPGCVDPYNEKVLRSTMASILRVPLQTKVDMNYLRKLQGGGYRFIGADVRGAIPLNQWKVGSKMVLVMGSESDGIQQELLAILDERVVIPMRGRAQSLNVGVATGLCLYHWQEHSR